MINEEISYKVCDVVFADARACEYACMLHIKKFRALTSHLAQVTQNCNDDLANAKGGISITFQILRVRKKIQNRLMDCC